jgi:hypothetical protein
MTALRLVLASLALPLVLAGCSGGPKLAPVKGTVTLDEKPIEKGTITFETPGQRSAIARIEKGQIVEATTFQPGDGVPVGKHQVAVSAHQDLAPSASSPSPGQAPRADYMSGKSLLPAAYSNPAMSGLTADIQAGENTVDFKLTSKGP